MEAVAGRVSRNLRIPLESDEQTKKFAESMMNVEEARDNSAAFCFAHPTVEAGHAIPRGRPEQMLFRFAVMAKRTACMDEPDKVCLGK
jgi:hypothetical protein